MKALIAIALCLSLTGCLSYQMGKAWRGGSKVPPPPVKTTPAKPVPPTP